MTKPTKTADWATDANYAAGVETYSGSPTKVDVTVTDQTKGNIPGALPTAQRFNDWQNRVGVWSRWFNDADVERRAWREAVTMIDGTLGPTEAGFDPSSSLYVYALTTSAAHPKQGSMNRTIAISKGTVFQVVGGDLLAYTFTGAEPEVSIDDAAGATPRVDLVECMIERDATVGVDSLANKITVQVVKGTPAASPVVPTLTAGFVALATVVVGASYAAAAGFKIDDTAGAVAVIHDQRMPIGVHGYVVRASAYGYSPDANGWGLNNQTLNCFGTGASQSDAWAPVPCEDGGRLVGLAVLQKGPGISSFDIRVARACHDNTNPVITALNGANSLQNATTNLAKTVAKLSEFEGSHTPAAGPTVLSSVAGIGVPVWTNGRRAWQDPHGVDSNLMSAAAIKYITTNTANQQLHAAEFWVAGSR